MNDDEEIQDDNLTGEEQGIEEQEVIQDHQYRREIEEDQQRIQGEPRMIGEELVLSDEEYQRMCEEDCDESLAREDMENRWEF
jgi:hypothetical protein